MTGSLGSESALRRRGLVLVYVTIGWNAFEGVAAIIAGIAAHSIALTAFGLDSTVEVFVSSVAAWQLRADVGDTRRDRTALRFIGASFIAIATYVGVQSVSRIASATRPEPSPIGIALTAAAAIMMTALGLAKRSIGRRLDNRVLQAEAKFSLVDAALSCAVLVGLVLNQALDWWWADPGVALGLAVFALIEGIEDVRT